MITVVDSTDEQRRQPDGGTWSRAWADTEQHIPVPDPLSQVSVARDIAARLKHMSIRLLVDEGALYAWRGKHWDELDPTVLRPVVHWYDGKPSGDSVLKLSKSFIDGVLHELQVMLSRPMFFADRPEGINAANGFIVFDDRSRPSLLAHDPDQRQRHVLPGRWTAEGAPVAPLLAKLVSGCFAGDPQASRKALVLCEVAGAVVLGLAPQLKNPRAVVLYGPRAQNGKSQALRALEGLVPETAVTSIPITDFGRDRYRVHLAGKLLNVCAELGSASEVASDKFKAIVSGDMISGRDVYRSMRRFRPIALHVFATNHLPSFETGMDPGVIRRLLVVPFDRVIPRAEQIENLGERIADDEADALLWYAVRGARRLLRSRDFSLPRSSRAALGEWQVEADPVRGFLDSGHVVLRAGVRTQSRDVYSRFRDWAKASGLRQLPGQAAFTKRLLTANEAISTARDARSRYVVGLELLGAEDCASSASSTRARSAARPIV